jgi:uncharacterized protein YecT (DUF1311 family)/multisubunit Na+/H+ antiporter MnhG subunit
MSDVLDFLSNTPIPTILIVAGLIFMLLALADKVSGHIQISGHNKKIALVIGVLLLITGIIIEYMIAGAVKEAQSDEKQAQDKKEETFMVIPFDQRSHPSFNCMRYQKLPKENRNPHSDIICAYKEVADSDRNMADYYKAYRNSRPFVEHPEIIQAQRQWVIERNQRCPASWETLETLSLAQNLGYCIQKLSNERAEYYKKKMAEQE